MKTLAKNKSHYQQYIYLFYLPSIGKVIKIKGGDDSSSQISVECKHKKIISLDIETNKAYVHKKSLKYYFIKLQMYIQLSPLIACIIHRNSQQTKEDNILDKILIKNLFLLLKMSFSCLSIPVLQKTPNYLPQMKKEMGQNPCFFSFKNTYRLHNFCYHSELKSILHGFKYRQMMVLLCMSCQILRDLYTV